MEYQYNLFAEELAEMEFGDKIMPYTERLEMYYGQLNLTHEQWQEIHYQLRHDLEDDSEHYPTPEEQKRKVRRLMIEDAIDRCWLPVFLLFICALLLANGTAPDTIFSRCCMAALVIWAGYGLFKVKTRGRDRALECINNINQEYNFRKSALEFLEKKLSPPTDPAK